MRLVLPHSADCPPTHGLLCGPSSRTADGRGDLALFVLADLPTGAVPAPLRRPARVGGHGFRAYGFPPGHPDGDWAAGSILGDAGPGHIQLEVESGHVIEGGFSAGATCKDRYSWRTDPLGGRVGRNHSTEIDGERLVPWAGRGVDDGTTRSGRRWRRLATR